MGNDRQCCSGPNHIFIFLCLHVTFKITVLFSLSHLHHRETHFHHRIDGIWLRTDAVLLFSSEWKHLHYVYTIEQFTSDYRLGFILYQTEFLRKYIHQSQIRKTSMWRQVCARLFPSLYCCFIVENAFFSLSLYKQILCPTYFTLKSTRTN